MSAHTDLDKLSVKEFAERFSDSLIPVSNTFSYFPALPLSEEDLKEYVEEPIAALPPAVGSLLRKVSILFVPYLEKANGKDKGEAPVDVVTFEKPPESRQSWCAQLIVRGQTSLVFAIKERHVADYHYEFYNAVAALIADHSLEEDRDRFSLLMREELSNSVHGEVDEKGWQLKQALLRRQSNVRRETKLFREYARQSFIDTMTLYLHGICCDIDVDTGPRQLPSRHLRRRLELLESLYPPPQGYAVFPEELNRDK
jgi:hypothetical protein